MLSAVAETVAEREPVTERAAVVRRGGADLEADISASASASASAGAQAHAVAPYALLRFATVPYVALEALRPTRCLAALTQAEAAAATASKPELVDALTSDLFTLVARIDADDKRYRRAVLQLKREVHNGAASTLAVDPLDRIAADLMTHFDAAAAARLAAWRQAQHDWHDAEVRARVAFTEEIAVTLRPGLRGLLRRDAFRHALALAAPGLLAHAARERRLPEKPVPDNFERSLLGYAIRAAAKTSPFSSFMATTALDLSTGLPAALTLTRLQHQCRTRLNRGVVARIGAAAITAGLLDLPLEVNPTLSQVGAQRFRALCDRLIVVLGRPWRQQTRTHFQLHETLSRVLLSDQGPAPAAIWCERFVAAGIDSAQAGELPRQLLARGMLQCPALSDGFDEAPEVTLRAALAAKVGPMAADVVRCIDDMIAACAEMSAEGGKEKPDAAADRTAGAERIRALEAEALARLGAGRVEPLQNVVLEDAWASGVVIDVTSDVDRGTATAGHRGAIQDLADFLATQVGVSPHYQRLRARFVERFGESGRCHDVLGFLSDAGTQLVAPVEFGATQEDEVIVPARTGARLPVTVQAQVIPGANGSAPSLVVNKVFENMAWLAARFAVGTTPEHGQLRAGLTRWLAQVAGEREPVDLPVGGECNDLQAHPRLTRRVLRLPGESFAGDGGIDLRDLHLRDEPATGELVLSDRAGRDLQLCYLGGTLPSPSWGLPYALVVLGQPHQLMRPAYQPPSWSSAADIEYVPRMMAGRAVVRRAMWWLSTDYLRRAWFSVQGAQRLAAVRAECRAQGLPTVFFARRPLSAGGAVASGNALEANRKPLWTDGANPFCLTLLERLCEGVNWISFTEALPAPGDGWLRIEGVPHVSELQFELLLQRTGG